MTSTIIKIGTRSSSLAIIQAEYIKKLLVLHNKLCPSRVEIVKITTKGDQILNQPLAKIGGKGLFTYELEAGLLSGELDLAVHSAKDLPPIDSANLHIAMFSERENASDVFLSHKYPSFESLPIGAIMGTSSIRRAAIIQHLRPDIKLTLLRGNIGTRLQALDDNKFDATILAHAGLKRLGLLNRITQTLSIEDFIPAPGQGALAIQTKKDNYAVMELLAPLSNQLNQNTIKCERYFTALLDGSCRTPLGAHAKIKNNKLLLSTMILSPDGKKVYRHHIEGDPANYESIAEAAATYLKRQAGPDFFLHWQ